MTGTVCLSRRPLLFRRGASRYASLAHFYYVLGMAFLRSYYHQILGPRRHLPKFSNSVCRYSEIFVCLNSHLIWQAAKSDVERGNAFALITGHRSPLIARQLNCQSCPRGEARTSRYFARNGERAIGNPVGLCYHANSRASLIVIGFS
jgi:hypothetical protein